MEIALFTDISQFCAPRYRGPEVVKWGGGAGIICAKCYTQFGVEIVTFDDVHRDRPWSLRGQMGGGLA